MVSGVFCFYEKHLVSELKKKKTKPKSAPKTLAYMFYRYLNGM